MNLCSSFNLKTEVFRIKKTENKKGKKHFFYTVCNSYGTVDCYYTLVIILISSNIRTVCSFYNDTGHSKKENDEEDKKS